MVTIRGYLLGIFLLNFMIPVSIAQQWSAPPVAEYDALSAKVALGLDTDAMRDAIDYLNMHPKDSDVQLLLAKLYIDHQQYAKAQILLRQLLVAAPGDIDISLLLTNLDLSMGNYQEAYDTLSLALILHPTDQALCTKQSTLMARRQMGQSPYAIGVDKSTMIVRHPLSAVPIKIAHVRREPPKKSPDALIYRNLAGVYQQQYFISDRHQIWDYSTLFYGHETGVGMLFGRVTYDNRLSYQAVQGEIEAYPKINKYLYLDVDFTFANQPNLFPDRAYGAEAYVSRLPWFDFSFGFKYNAIDDRHHFTTYSGTLSKESKGYRVLFRPYYFVPGIGRNSALYILDLRRIVVDPYYYFGVVLGLGSSPDLADLVTVNFIVLQNKIFNPYINFALCNDRLIVNLSVLAQNQIFPTGRNRNWYGGAIGLSWRY